MQYPTCVAYYLETMPTMLLETLVRESDWPIPWDSEQVSLLCSLVQFCYSPDLDDISEYVEFWVTSPHEEVKTYLQAKSALLEMIFSRQRVEDAGRWARDLLHKTIHDGAETIALLTEHDHHVKGAPWIRHRVKKLVLIRAFLVDTMGLILTTWRHELAVPYIIRELTEHAMRHNLRTMSIWKQALRKAQQDSQRHGVVTPK